MPWGEWTGPGLLRRIGWAGGRCLVPAILRESLRAGGPALHDAQPQPNPAPPPPPDKSEATLITAQQLPPEAPCPVDSPRGNPWEQEPSPDSFHLRPRLLPVQVPHLCLSQGCPLALTLSHLSLLSSQPHLLSVCRSSFLSPWLISA